MLSPIQPKNNKGLFKKTKNSSDPKIGERGISFPQTLEAELVTQSQNSITPPKKAICLDDISPLVGDLETRGQELSRLPSLENFHRFRHLLQKIINKIVPHALEVKKGFLLNPTDLSQKEFYFITGVNKELNSLLKMIETNYKDHFKIANQVTSIKGLIVNFYV